MRVLGKMLGAAFVAVCCFFTLVFCAETEPESFVSIETATAWYRANASSESMTPDSTAIASAEYFPASTHRALIVTFTSNPAKPYLYGGVPAEIWQQFKTADSKGRFFNASIRGRYPFLLQP